MADPTQYLYLYKEISTKIPIVIKLLLLLYDIYNIITLAKSVCLIYLVHIYLANQN